VYCHRRSPKRAFTVARWLANEPERQLTSKPLTPNGVLHALGDLVFILDREQRVTAAFGRSFEAGQYETSQFLGKTIAEEWPPDVAALHVEMNARGLEGQVVVYDWEYPFRGSGRRMMTLICPLYAEAGGAVIGVVRSSRDLGVAVRPLATQTVQFALQQPNPRSAGKSADRQPTQRRVKGRAHLSTRSDEAVLASEQLRDVIFRLSPRERLIVGQLLDSARTSQIARNLKISVHTVRQHLKHILRKAGVHSQQELLELLRGKRST
jgi:DNA-binding CsgD family transcriptional regulator